MLKILDENGKAVPLTDRTLPRAVVPVAPIYKPPVAPIYQPPASLSKAGEERRPIRQDPADIATMKVLPKTIPAGLASGAQEIVRGIPAAVAYSLATPSMSKRYEESNKYQPKPISLQQKQTAQKVAEFAQNLDIYPGEKVEKFIEQTQQEVGALPRKSDRLLAQTGMAIGQNTARMGFAVLGGPVAGWSAFASQVFGQSFKQAMDEGYDPEVSGQFAVGSTLLELGTETMFGGMPGFGKGVIAKLAMSPGMADITTKVGMDKALRFFNGIGKVLKSDNVRFIIDTLGEGVEEFAADALEPYVRTATLGEEFQKADMRQAGESFIVGVLMSLFLQGGSKLRNGKVIDSIDKVNELSKAEVAELAENINQEFGSELERLAHESNVRKGKISEGEPIQQWSAEAMADERGLPMPDRRGVESRPLRPEFEMQGWRESQNVDIARAKRSLISDILNELQGLEKKDATKVKRIVKGITGDMNNADLYKALTEIIEDIPIEVIETNPVLWDIKRRMQQSPLKITEHMKADIADYGDFRRRAMGNVLLANSGDAVDVLYQELTELAPDLFPVDIINEHEQLLRIVDIMKSLKKTEAIKASDSYSADVINNEFVRPIVDRIAEYFIETHVPEGEYTVRRSARNIPRLQRNIYAQAQGTRELPFQATSAEVQQARNLPQQISQTEQQHAPQQIPQIEQQIPQATQQAIEQAYDSGDVAQIIDDAGMSRAASDVLKGATKAFHQKFVEAGGVLKRIAKITGDDALFAYFDNARKAKGRAYSQFVNAQTDVYGNKVGASLVQIFSPIMQKGKPYYKAFQEYMYHLHNIDRMQQDKPVFGESVTAEASQQIANELINAHPEFADYAQQVRAYIDNLVQYRIDTGLWSDDTADVMASMYKNYVPTFRSTEAVARGKKKGVRVDQVLQRAVGGKKDLLPLHKQLELQTARTVSAGMMNLFGLRLLQNATPETADYIRSITQSDAVYDIDAMDAIQAGEKFKIFKDGKAVEMEVSPDVVEALKAFDAKSSNDIIKLLTSGNSIFKQLITSWSPIFLITNPIKDAHDVVLYTKDLKAFAKTWPHAISEIVQNGKLWQQYQAVGGIGSSLFDLSAHYKGDRSWLARNTVDRIEHLNLLVEQLPRFTEYMATMNKDKTPTLDTQMKALYNAADVTVNFGAGGEWGKFINKTFVPFFNPAVQGADRFVRMFTEADGAKDWMVIVGRLAFLGVLPSLLNEMLYYDDEEYEALPDWMKDTYYMFKLPNGMFAKIPKGRALAVSGSAGVRTYRKMKGEENVYNGMMKLALEQIGPQNPMTANIWSPMIDIPRNRQWHGGAVEPRRLERYAPADRYTEATTSVSKALVKRFEKFANKADFSPMKLDALIKAYSGVVGDLAMPLFTPQAERNPFSKRFIADPVMQNKVSEDFYETLTELGYANASEGATDADKVTLAYMNKVNSQASELYSKIREIQGGLGTDKYKKAAVREVKQELNDIQLAGLSKLEDVQKAANDKLGIQDYAEYKREVYKDVFGAAFALQDYNKDVYKRAQAMNKQGINYDLYYNLYFALKDVQSDKDAKGNSIQYSSSRKKKEIIDKMMRNKPAGIKQLVYRDFDISQKVW